MRRKTVTHILPAKEVSSLPGVMSRQEVSEVCCNEGMKYLLKTGSMKVAGTDTDCCQRSTAVLRSQCIMNLKRDLPMCCVFF